MATDPVFRDVPISCFQNDSIDIVYVDPGNAYDDFDIDVSRAGGYNYQNLTHRFILWKIQGNDLELIEYSTQDDLIDNSICLRFSNQLIPNIKIIEDKNQPTVLFLFVITSNNRLYRFIFNHPSNLPKINGKPKESIFKDQNITIPSRMIKISNIAAQSSIQCFDCLSDSSVAIGSLNGSIYITTLQNDSNYNEIELKSSGIISKLWQSMKLGSNDTSKCINSLLVEQLSNQNIIISISNDKYLRVWSTLKNSLSQTLEIPDNDEGLYPSNLFIKSCKINSSSFFLLVRVDYEPDQQIQQSEFYLYKYKKGKLKYLYHISPPEIEIIDFGFSKSILWVTGSHGVGSYLTQYISIISENNSLSIDSIDNWNSIYGQHYCYLQNDHISHRSIDISDEFLDRILFPGRFNKKIINEALLELYPDIFDDNNIVSIKSSIIEALNNNSFSDINDNDNTDKYLRWKRFLDCCEQIWKRDSKPIGLFISNNNLNNLNNIICVIGKENCFFIRPCTESEDIQRSFVYNDFNRIDNIFYNKYSNNHNYDNSNNNNLYSKLFTCSYLLHSSFEPGQINLLDQELFHVNDTGTSFVQCIQLLYSTNQKNNIHNSLDSIFTIIKQIKNPILLFERFLEFCEDQISYQIEDNDFSSSIMDTNTIQISNFTKKILSSCFLQLSQVNYSIIRNMTLLVFFLIRNKQIINLSIDNTNLFHSKIIPKLLTYTRQFCVFNWLSLQQTSPTATLEKSFSISNLHEQFDSSLQLKQQNNYYNDDIEILPLIQAYLPSTIQIPGKYNTMDNYMSDDDNDDNMELLIKDSIIGYNFWSEIIPILHVILSKLAKSCYRLNQFSDPAPSSTMEDMASFLDNTNQYLILQQFIRLQHSNSNQLSYYLGRVYLHLQQFEKAADYFAKASHDLIPEKLLKYNEDVSDLFKKYGSNRESIDFLLHSLEILNLSEEKKEELWSKVFILSLNQADYDLAYNAMIHSGEYKQENLKSIIIELCEEGRLDLLCFNKDYSFPWSGMMNFTINNQNRKIALVDGVDIHLQKLALEHDILYPPYYYQILYSFHSIRGNYMKAGQAMTTLADRLNKCSSSEISFVDRLEKQRNCYLAAINVFRLIHDDFAWVESEGSYKDSTFAVPSPKRMRDGDSNYSNSLTNSKLQHRIIMSLKDLKLKYYITNCKLELARKDLYSQTGEFTMNEQDTLSLLVSENYLEKAITLSKLCSKDIEQTGLKMVFRKLIQNIIGILKHHSSESSYVQSKWNDLKKYLEKYDNDNNVQYYLVVTEELLTAGITVPNWIGVKLRLNSGALLRLYLSHHKFEDAADINTQNKSIWLPYTQIDQLLQSTVDKEVKWIDKLSKIKNLYNGFTKLHSNIDIDIFSEREEEDEEDEAFSVKLDLDVDDI